MLFPYRDGTEQDRIRFALADDLAIELPIDLATELASTIVNTIANMMANTIAMTMANRPTFELTQYRRQSIPSCVSSRKV